MLTSCRPCGTRRRACGGLCGARRTVSDRVIVNLGRRRVADILTWTFFLRFLRMAVHGVRRDLLGGVVVRV